MVKVLVNPGICGLETSVSAVGEEDDMVKVQVTSACPSVQKMMDALGDTFDAFEICLVKPGANPLYQYASENFPVHAACPAIAGIGKAIEAAAGLALPRDASIVFLSE